MTAAAPAVIPLDLAEIAQHDAFRAAQAEVNDGQYPQPEEMLDAIDRERSTLSISMRGAKRQYGADYDAATMRRYVVLGYVADLVSRVAAKAAQRGQG